MLRFAPKGEDIQQVVNNWKHDIQAAPHCIPALQMYVGRSIQEAKKVSHQLNAKLFIVSAGIGLQEANSLIPGYDLSASEVSFNAMLTRHGSSKSEWWKLLVKEKGLSWLLHEHPESIVYLSLPSEYLTMVCTDLSESSSETLSRIRVFTSEAGNRKIRNLAGLSVLPYDDRLESHAGYAGTRSDFPQRALKHFVFDLGAHLLETDEASRVVIEAMNSLSKKIPSKRIRLDDHEICRLIRDSWDLFGGNSSKLLRYLRNQKLVSCEQGRFSRLRRQVAEDIKGSKSYSEH